MSEKNDELLLWHLNCNTFIKLNWKLKIEHEFYGGSRLPKILQYDSYCKMMSLITAADREATKHKQ